MKIFTNEVVLIIFNELYDYANSHLKFEEQYFDKSNETDVNLHKLQHKNSIEQLDEIKHSLNENNLSNELIYFVADWLLVHIQYEDKKHVQINILKINNYPLVYITNNHKLITIYNWID
jgi:hemerythrin-like metal-binding protein